MSSRLDTLPCGVVEIIQAYNFVLSESLGGWKSLGAFRGPHSLIARHRMIFTSQQLMSLKDSHFISVVKHSPHLMYDGPVFGEDIHASDKSPLYTPEQKTLIIESMRRGPEVFSKCMELMNIDHLRMQYLRADINNTDILSWKWMIHYGIIGDRLLYARYISHFIDTLVYEASGYISLCTSAEIIDVHVRDESCLPQHLADAFMIVKSVTEIGQKESLHPLSPHHVKMMRVSSPELFNRYVMNCRKIKQCARLADTVCDIVRRRMSEWNMEIMPVIQSIRNDMSTVASVVWH